jgi:2-polyprenyl-6-methoxyphenol hydroxylase-like FAD-dependent oxidoreductase
MTDTLTAKVCIAGGGPAGLVLGLLLSRAGIDTLVLEKHADFLRDFRGDTVHPSTLEIFHELGLLDELLRRPHHKVARATAVIGRDQVQIADFTHLPTHAKYIAFIPQHEFLEFVRNVASARPTFRLLMGTEADGLIEAHGMITGVTASQRGERLTIRSDLVVAADGRHSTLRRLAHLKVDDLGAPIDVLWFRLSRQPTDPGDVLGRVDRGKMMVMLDRGDYWQCAFLILKGEIEHIEAQGLASFRQSIVDLAPFLAERLTELASWNEVKLLSVRLDRLEEWARPGLLCIGDAAHAMSPVGGVGINLAIQDAVAAANILRDPLHRGQVGLDDLKKVQARRELPTRVTQTVQKLIHERVLSRVLSGTASLTIPRSLRAVAGRLPWLSRIPAWFIGIGIRPEHPRERAQP